MIDIIELMTPEPGMHITTVHRSCLEAHGIRLRLSRLCIDDHFDTDEYRVKRVSHEKYAIRGMRFTFADALAILEGRTPLPTKEPRDRTVKVLPITDLPLFKGIAA